MSQQSVTSTEDQDKLECQYFLPSDMYCHIHHTLDTDQENSTTDKTLILQSTEYCVYGTWRGEGYQQVRPTREAFITNFGLRADSNV